MSADGQHAKVSDRDILRAIARAHEDGPTRHNDWPSTADLVTQVDVARSTVVSHLDHLREAGLVESKPTLSLETGRDCRTLHLTDAGRDALAGDSR